MAAPCDHRWREVFQWWCVVFMHHHWQLPAPSLNTWDGIKGLLVLKIFFKYIKKKKKDVQI